MQSEPAQSESKALPAISVRGAGKMYRIFDRPQDRLKEGLFSRFGHQYGREFWALRNVSFDVEKGSAVGVIGRNGSGKSTLLQIIAGILQPTTGSVQVNGRVAALLELGSGFNPEYTGRENVFMNAAILGLSREQTEARFDEIAAFAEIGQFMDQPVKTYSSGMQMRLAFSVAACTDPDILLVDEALSVGDAMFQFKCLERLQSLMAAGKTLLLVSHDMGVFKSFCHRGIYLAKGEERARGIPDELAELYFLDIREDQSRHYQQERRVTRKKTLKQEAGLVAFGTDEGHIEKAVFDGTECQNMVFMPGERVGITVSLRYRGSVENPHLGILLQTLHLLNLGGKVFPLEGVDAGDGWRQATVQIEFKASLTAGRYVISLRLENRLSPRRFYPIDKQSGLMTLEIMDQGSSILGAVDFAMQMTHLDGGEVPV